MKKFKIFAALLFVFCLNAGALWCEEVVTAYTTLEASLAQKLFAAFEEESGIKVNWERLSGGEAIARLESEREKPKASIWVGGVGTQHVEAKLRGLSEPYRSKFAFSIPAMYRDNENYWTGLYVGPICFCINKNSAVDLNLPTPRTWSDLIAPVYDKKIRMAHPSTSGTGYNVITTLIRVNKGDEEKAFEYFKKLNNSIERYTRSGSAPGKSCVSGDIPLAIGYFDDLVRAKAQGAPIEVIVPEDGTGFETASMSLLKGAPEPDNAKKLYDWILGEKAMNIIAGDYVIPLSKKAKPLETGFSLAWLNLVEQDDKWDAENKERLIKRWIDEISPVPEN